MVLRITGILPQQYTASQRGSSRLESSSPLGFQISCWPTS